MEVTGLNKALYYRFERLSCSMINSWTVGGDAKRRKQSPEGNVIKLRGGQLEY